LSARASLVTPPRLAAALLATLLVAGVASICVGATWQSPATVLRGIAAACGIGAPLEGPLQTIVELRLWRTLCASLVGASLAYSGGLIQGVFRNGLASPSLIGVTGGAALGAALAILVVGGYAPRLVLEHVAGVHALLIPLCAFLGALATTALVAFLASGGGRVSVTTLLLVGIAVNMCIGGMFAAIQYLSLKDWEVSKAILAWTFGTLTDRSGVHCATVAIGLALAAAAIPFCARELDLFKGGESDARSLGVHTERVKLLALTAAALAASCAVAVAGQIAFVGLVVPHLVRLLGISRYRALLPLALPAGAAFLLCTDLLQRVALGEGALQPGVMMSLVGGPFFVFLLVRQRREISAW
jgi:iron complex transport system permease protein